MGRNAGSKGSRWRKISWNSRRAAIRGGLYSSDGRYSWPLLQSKFAEPFRPIRCIIRPRSVELDNGRILEDIAFFYCTVCISISRRLDSKDISHRGNPSFTRQLVARAFQSLSQPVCFASGRIDSTLFGIYWPRGYCITWICSV